MFQCKMVLDVLWLKGTDIQFLKHQILIQISYCINLMPGNCTIAELLTTCKHSGFWQNEHVLPCFTVLVTVSKGSTYVSTCIDLLPALVLQF